MVRPVFGDNDRCCCCLSAVYPCRIYTHCFGVDQGGFQRQVGFPGSGILSEFGLFQSSTNVNNELITFQSPALMTEVVKRFRLDMNYFVPGKFHRQVAYGLTLPVDVTISDFPENESAGFTLEVQPDSTYSYPTLHVTGRSSTERI